MNISVIISTWNNADRLADTLRAFCECQAKDALTWELVLVNNNCTDHTDRVVATYKDQLPLRYIHEPTPGLSHGRNAGLAQASGDLILFTDDDVRPCKDWLEIYWQAYCAYPENTFFGGSIESVFEGRPPEPALLRIAPFSVRGLNFGPHERALTKKENFISANWACPAKAIQMAGGFDPELGLNPDCGEIRVGEESDLMNCLRVKGWEPWYLSAARIKHIVPEDKCGQEHILQRREASIKQDALRKLKGSSGVVATLIIKAYIYFVLVVFWLAYKIAPWTGKPGFFSYTVWHGYLAAIRIAKSQKTL